MLGELRGKWLKKKEGNNKTHAKKKHKHILVSSQRYQDTTHLLQNPTVLNYVVGFSNCAQRFTPLNYLSYDSPFKYNLN